jgi:hypothetical protein
MCHVNFSTNDLRLESPDQRMDEGTLKKVVKNYVACLSRQEMLHRNTIYVMSNDHILYTFCIGMPWNSSIRYTYIS